MGLESDFGYDPYQHGSGSDFGIGMASTAQAPQIVIQSGSSNPSATPSKFGILYALGLVGGLYGATYLAKKHGFKMQVPWKKA